MEENTEKAKINKVVNEFVSIIHKTDFVPFEDGPHLEWHDVENGWFVLYDKWADTFRFVRAETPEEARKL